MSRRVPLLLCTVILILLAGCGKKAPLAPIVDDPSPSGDSPQTFVLTSAADARLPAPMAEAAGAPRAEIAWLDLVTGPRAGEALVAGDNSVVVWNQLTTELGLAARIPPPLFSRAYALTHVAINDALIAGGFGPRGGLVEGALAAGAASKVLTYLFPRDSARIAAVAAAEVGSPSDHERHRLIRSWLLGRFVGQLVVYYGQHDGSDAVFTGPMPTGDCIWTGTNPALPVCGTWKCWITTSGAEFQPEPPYACGSPEDLADIASVLDASLHRTPDQIAIVHKWADLPPPTVWCGLLNERIASHHLGIRAAARAHAFLNTTMEDAFISCWRTKYQYWTARPFQRIPGLVTVIPTPNFPTYTSGHSTISGAAAQVMGELFPAEQSYFEAQAEEAAISRFWGGIHFHHDDDAGLVVGTKIGEKAVRFMRFGIGGHLIAAVR